MIEDRQCSECSLEAFGVQEMCLECLWHTERKKAELLRKTLEDMDHKCPYDDEHDLSDCARCDVLEIT